VIRLPEGAHSPLGRHPCIPKQNRQCPSVTTPQRKTTEVAADPSTAGDDRGGGSPWRNRIESAAIWTSK
jgi:hypothetical protein